MKLRHKLALALALGNAASLAGTARAVSPDSAPPVGRSLFDLLVAKKQPDGTFILDVPFPFDNLVKTLATRAQGTAAGAPSLPTMVLIPNGRSLQRDHADAVNPRVVVGFTDHPAKNTDVSVMLRDRVYVGYGALANQLEVISFNEEAGRFEFEIVSDYRDGGARSVLYTDRAFCTQCHKAQVPIFSKNTWDETNANIGVFNAVKASSPGNEQQFFNIIPTRATKGMPYAIDISTDRGARLLSLAKTWKKGCKDVTVVQGLPDGFKSEDCRAHVFLYAMAGAVGLDASELSKSEGGYTFVPFETIAELWKKNLTEDDLTFFTGDLVNRNPSGFSDFQMLQMPSEADRIALWKRNLAADKTIDEVHEPKTTPLAAFQYVDGVDKSKQALDLSIALLSSFVTPTERATLPKTADAFKTRIQANFKGIVADAAAFGDAPPRKGLLMASLMKAMNVSTLAGQPLTANFFADQAKLPPPKVDEGIGTHSVGAVMVNKYCATSCHGVPGFGVKLDFLVREPGMSDRDLWIKVIKHEKEQPCVRTDWNLPVTVLPKVKRMPRGPEQANLVKAELETGTSDRKFLMDTYRDKLLEFSADADAKAALGMDEKTLKGFAGKCNWTKFNGN